MGAGVDVGVVGYVMPGGLWIGGGDKVGRWRRRRKCLVCCASASSSSSTRSIPRESNKGEDKVGESGDRMNVKQRQGRKKRRGGGEIVQEHRCRRCGMVGHNVRNCPQMPVGGSRGLVANEEKGGIDMVKYDEVRKSLVGGESVLKGFVGKSRRRLVGKVDVEEGSVAWFRQRCGHCGEAGHNKRNCTELRRRVCVICKGSGRLVCGKCEGLGYVGGLREGEEEEEDVERRWGIAEMKREKRGKGGRGGGRAGGGVGGLSPEMRVRVEAVRARARRVVESLKDDEGDVLVGGGGKERKRPKMTFAQMKFKEREENSRCARCQGTGHLSCLACSD